MRRLLICALVVSMSPSLASAAATPAPGPEPATAPPAAPAPEAMSRSRVIVPPFTEANEQFQPDWISRAIHRAVVDELSSLSAIDVVQTDAAATDAKAADAQYIVRGTIQRLNGEIRVSGRVQNVADNKSIGGFKATGPQHQLFAIEDSIADQLKRILAPMEADPGLEGVRPVARSGGDDPRTLPTQPLRGVYEGSDLQRALDDRDFLNRAARRAPTSYDPPVYPPTYPTGYGGYPPYPGYGYGYGYGWGWPGWGLGGNIIIVKKGHHGRHHGGGSVGGGGGAIQAHQMQQLRSAAVFGHNFSGQSNMVISPSSGQAPSVGGGQSVGHGGGRR